MAAIVDRVQQIVQYCIGANVIFSYRRILSTYLLSLMEIAVPRLRMEAKLNRTMLEGNFSRNNPENRLGINIRRMDKRVFPRISMEALRQQAAERNK